MCVNIVCASESSSYVATYVIEHLQVLFLGLFFLTIKYFVEIYPRVDELHSATKILHKQQTLPLFKVKKCCEGAEQY